MANVNKVILICRLTRDPEVKMFANGGKVAKLGAAVNNRKKNNQSGQWEDDPVFIDVEVFNRGESGRMADLAEQNLRKGSQVFIEGHLKMEQWTSQDGQKRSKIVVVCDNFQFLDPKGEQSEERQQTRQTQRSLVGAGRSQAAPPDDMDSGLQPAPAGRDDSDIPFAWILPLLPLLGSLSTFC